MRWPQARLAEVAVRYADIRIAEEQAAAAGSTVAGPDRPRPGEFVADEVAVMLREQPYQVRCLLARSRRLAAGLPTVWEAFQRGDLDAEQVRVIDRVARRATEPQTLVAIDEKVIDAAHLRTGQSDVADRSGDRRRPGCVQRRQACRR